MHPDLRPEGNEEQYNDRMQQVRSRYSVLWPTFATDGVPNYSHYSPIRKLTFITKVGSTSAQIGVLDELLTVSTWSLVETDSRGGGLDFDLSLRIGGRFKLIENYNENFMYVPELAKHQSLLSKESNIS